MHSNHHRHLARFSSPSSRPRRNATALDMLATLNDRFTETDTENPSRIGGHLSYLESLLRMRSTRHLDATQRDTRELLLDLLLVYASGRSFAQGVPQDGDRPCQVDERGVFCPIGFMLAHTLGRQFAMEVCSAESIDVLPRATRARLASWIHNSGLSIEEFRMIQPGFVGLPMEDSADTGDLHPYFQRLMVATKARIADYLSRAFVGSSWTLQQPAPSRTVLLADLFRYSPPADPASDTVPLSALAKRFSRSF